MMNELERFRAKWIPVRVKKTRQNKNLEPRSDSIGTEKALGGRRAVRPYFAPRLARQRHADDGAGAELRAQPHRSAVQVGERSGDRQAQSRTVIGLGELALDLLERPAQPQKRLRRDPDPGVGNRENDGIAAQAAADHHLAA